MAFEKRDIPKKTDGLADWYNKVVLKAELADYGPAKGTMIFRPYGYAIWENLQAELNMKIKERGVQNAYFPLFIPESLLKKEKDHIKGFSPELAVVTIGGGVELEEKLVVRPTSETIMYEAYSRWINSWRDLPVLINQWNNVVRWEKRTYLFLRTTEFLWQEGHTAHATHDEALEIVNWAITMYEATYREMLAIPGYVGQKSKTEKFAGADMSMTFETLMPEGKALQSSTAHDLGQNFAKGFKIDFLDEKGSRQYVWQTSWGLSTRSIGAMLMIHGDDQGLRLPPRVAPVQVIIVPIRETAELKEKAQEIQRQLLDASIRVQIDDRDNQSLGSKINEWELKGVPVRIELGPKELEQNTVTLARRDTLDKESISIADLVERVPVLLTDIQNQLLLEAQEYLQKNTHETADYEEFKKIMSGSRGFIKSPWCEEAICETKIKEETKATTRCLPRDAEVIKGTCIKCGKPAKHSWFFALAY